MLKAIRLNNFKKHRSFHATPGAGLVSLVGDNGAGKSTVLKAVLYALFGASAAGDKANFKTWNSAGPHGVELIADLPGYGEVVISRTDKSAKIVRGDDLLASGQTPVTAFIEEALGMDAKTLRLLAYSPQGEAQGLLSMGAASLQRKVEDVAKMGVIDKVLGMIQTDLAELDGRLKGIGDPPDLDVLEEAALKAERTAQEAHVEAQRAEAYRLHLEEGIRHLETTYQQGKEYWKEVSAAQEKLSALTAERRELAEKIAAGRVTLGALPQLGISVATMKADKARLQAEIERYSLDIDRIQTRSYELARQQKFIKDSEVRLRASEEAEERLVEMAQQEERAASISLEADSKVAEINRELRRLDTSLEAAVCVTCGREFEPGALEAATKEREKQRESYREAHNKALAAKEAYRAAQFLRRETEKKLAPGLAEQVASAEQEVERINRSLLDIVDKYEAEAIPAPLSERVSEVLTTISNERDKNKSDLLTIDKAYAQACETESKRKYLSEKIADWVVRDTEIQAEIEGILESLPGLETEAKQFDLKALSEQIKVKNSELTEATWAWVSAREKAVSCSLSHEQLIKSIEQAKETIETYTAVLADRDDINALQKYLRANRARLSSSLWDGLLEYASYLLDSMTDGRLSNIRRTDSGDFLVQEHEFAVPVYELSGAQKSFVGLALRVAMTKVFYGNGLFLLLDEPSADATDANAAAVAGMLRGLGSQVLLVTHRSGDALNADEIIQI